MGIWTNLNYSFSKEENEEIIEKFMTILRYIAYVKESYMWEATISNVENKSFSISIDGDLKDEVIEEIKEIAHHLSISDLILINQITTTPLGKIISDV